MLLMYYYLVITSVAKLNYALLFAGVDSMDELMSSSDAS